MWFVLIFAVVHIYFVFLSSVIEHIGTFDSIFSGYKFMPSEKRTTREQRNRAGASATRRLAYSFWDWAMSCSVTTGWAPRRSPASSATTAFRRASDSRTAARLVFRSWADRRFRTRDPGRRRAHRRRARDRWCGSMVQTSWMRCGTGCLLIRSELLICLMRRV